jgi:hypothetical protein
MGKSVIYFVECYIILMQYYTHTILKVAVTDLVKVIYETITLNLVKGDNYDQT